LNKGSHGARRSSYATDTSPRSRSNCQTIAIVPIAQAATFRVAGIGVAQTDPVGRSTDFDLPPDVPSLKARYGGMELSDAKRLQQREDENAKRKRLLADAMIGNVVLKDLLGKP
jgi:hypothetical protein